MNKILRAVPHSSGWLGLLHLSKRPLRAAKMTHWERPWCRLSEFEFNPQNPHDRKRALTPTHHPHLYTAPQRARLHTHTNSPVGLHSAWNGTYNEEAGINNSTSNLIWTFQCFSFVCARHLMEDRQCKANKCPERVLYEPQQPNSITGKLHLFLLLDSLKKLYMMSKVLSGWALWSQTSLSEAGSSTQELPRVAGESKQTAASCPSPQEHLAGFKYLTTGLCRSEIEWAPHSHLTRKSHFV